MNAPQGSLVTEESSSFDLLGNNVGPVDLGIPENQNVIRLNGLFEFIHSNQMMIIKTW